MQPEFLKLDVTDHVATVSMDRPPDIPLSMQALNRVEHMTLKKAYRTEQDYTVRLSRYDDSKEAMQAFRERREPLFRGR